MEHQNVSETPLPPCVLAVRDAAPRPLSVLLIEDEPVLAKNINSFLTRQGYEVFEARSGEAGLELFDRINPGVVLLDYNLPGMNGLEVLAGIVARDTGAKVVVMTGNGSEDTAITALKGGVADYLIKPIALAGMLPLIDRLSGRVQPVPVLAPVPALVSASAPDVAPSYCDTPVLQRVRAMGGVFTPGIRLPADAPNAGLVRLVGESAPMRRLKTLIGKVIDADMRLSGADSPVVLITGETGTGKGLVARALHFEGRRKTGPFIEINCAGIPAALLEAELFGHERGAFTDAKEAKPGLIESAAGGTLFLDEIGDLDLASQAKLLKVLEERRVRRIGAVHDRSIDTRFLAATSCDLEIMVREGRFRADLYYRLRMIRVHVPPLRERGVDVVRLAEHFLGIYGGRYGKPGLRLSSDAMAALNRHAWEGNVRELKNTIEQAVVFANGDIIGNCFDSPISPRQTRH